MENSWSWSSSAQILAADSKKCWKNQETALQDTINRKNPGLGCEALEDLRWCWNEWCFIDQCSWRGWIKTSMWTILKKILLKKFTQIHEQWDFLSLSVSWLTLNLFFSPVQAGLELIKRADTEELRSVFEKVCKCLIIIMMWCWPNSSWKYSLASYCSLFIHPCWCSPCSFAGFSPSRIVFIKSRVCNF